MVVHAGRNLPHSYHCNFYYMRRLSLCYFQRDKENTVISLQFDKRKKERDDAEKKRQAVARTRSTPAPGLAPEDSVEAKLASGTGVQATLAKLDKDLYLKETGRILADFITSKK